MNCCLFIFQKLYTVPTAALYYHKAQKTLFGLTGCFTKPLFDSTLASVPSRLPTLTSFHVMGQSEGQSSVPELLGD